MQADFKTKNIYVGTNRPTVVRKPHILI